MRIHVGCQLTFEFPQTTPMIVTLNVHFSRFPDLESPDRLMTNPSVPVEGYRDSFGNWCSRLVAPAGRFSLGTDAVVRDSGLGACPCNGRAGRFLDELAGIANVRDELTLLHVRV
jgi:hypothetical protein